MSTAGQQSMLHQTNYNTISISDYDRICSAESEPEVKPILEKIEKLAAGKSLRVLELGCGSGRYTMHLLNSKVVSSILAVDVSAAMIAYADSKFARDENLRQKVRFMRSDCSQRQVFDGGNFDLVFTAWMLECAPDRRTLENMWHVISMNLRSGGHVVAATCGPTEDPRSAAVDEVLGDTDHGIAIRCRDQTDSGQELVIDEFFIKQSVMEESAKGAGMTGRPEWQSFEYKKEDKRPPGAILTIAK